jgi:hypothetical protein
MNPILKREDTIWRLIFIFDLEFFGINAYTLAEK